MGHAGWRRSGCRIEDFRHVAARYDKLATDVLSAVPLRTLIAFRLRPSLNPRALSTASESGIEGGRGLHDRGGIESGEVEVRSSARLNAEPIDHRPHHLMLACAFLLGCLKAPMPVAIEFAQVQFNWIIYPADAPWGAYLASGWSLINQVIGLLLAARLDTAAVTVILAGLIAIVFAEGFYRLALTVTRHAGSAAVIALAMICLRIGTMATPVYSIEVFSAHIHGMLGLGWLVLIVGLLVGGAVRGGGFCLGLAPAIHATNGLWLLVCIGLGTAVMFWRERHDTRSTAVLLRSCRLLFRWLAFGLLGTIASFMLLYTTSPQFDVPDNLYRQEAEYLRQYFFAWVPLLKGHYDILSWSLVVPILAMVTTLGVLTGTLAKRVLEKGDVVAGWTLSCLLPSAVLGGLLLFAATMLGNEMPLWFWRGMPGRWFDLTVMTGGVLVLATLLRADGTETPGGRAAFAAFIVAAVVDRPLLRLFFGVTDAYMSAVVFYNIVVLIIGGLVALHRLRSDGRPGARYWAFIPCGTSLLALTLAVSLGYFAARMINENRARSWPQASSSAAYLRSADDRYLWSKARSLPGMLLNGDCMQSLQMYSGRPVTMSADLGVLNLLPYRPDLGPWIARDLKDFFDIDYFAPSEDAATCPASSVRRAFEARTREQWIDLGHRRGVGMVYAPADWRIDLPMAARTTFDALYSVPADQSK